MFRAIVAAVMAAVAALGITISFNPPVKDYLDGFVMDYPYEKTEERSA